MGKFTKFGADFAPGHGQMLSTSGLLEIILLRNSRVNLSMSNLMKGETKLKKNIRAYLFILIISFLFTGTYAQKATRQSSVDAFSQGKYEEAYALFSELLARYPKDPLYKYYSAACLVNLERKPDEASELLRAALNSGSVKSMPDDALYYYGRALQFQGRYDEAEKAYSRFTGEAGRKRAKDLNVPEYIQQCRENEGRLEQALVAVADEPRKAATAARTVEAPAKQSLPADLDSRLEESLEKQFKTDSVEAAAAKPLAALPATSVPVAEQEIKPVETRPAPGTIEPLPEVAPAIPVVQAPAEIVTEIRDTTIKLREQLNRPVGVLSSFEILPEPVTDPKATIEINPEPPEGLVYRIQTAVFRNPVSLSYFKGISPIFGFRSPGANVTTYYAGIFRQAADASKALASVRSRGFKDAFVVGQAGNKIVSMERAAILEKEWGTKPLFNIESTLPQQQLDTVPPTLLLKVEVMRSLQPLKEEAIEPMRRIAGKRNFDILTLENGSSAYLVGNFITFESAEEFAGLLQRNGYREAKVVAWLGRREIDIQTARQLFETLK